MSLIIGTIGKPLGGCSMKRMLFSSLVVSAVIATGYASAADLAYRAPVAVAPAFSWTGFYIGAQGGAGEQFASILGGSGLGIGGGQGAGAFAGGQIGYNYQINGLVIGIEGEGLWSNIKSRQDVSVGGLAGIALTSTQTNKAFYDVAVRLGYTLNDRTLIYSKLGAVWSNQNFSLNVNAPLSVSASWTAPGVLIGGGFEYAITNNWTARFETDFLLYAATDANFNVTGPTTTTITATTNNVNIIAKIGASYKF
jgi:outer membrane immunogenic protein